MPGPVGPADPVPKALPEGPVESGVDGDGEAPRLHTGEEAYVPSKHRSVEHGLPALDEPNILQQRPEGISQPPLVFSGIPPEKQPKIQVTPVNQVTRSVLADQAGAGPLDLVGDVVEKHLRQLDPRGLGDASDLIAVFLGHGVHQLVNLLGGQQLQQGKDVLGHLPSQLLEGVDHNLHVLGHRGDNVGPPVDRGHVQVHRAPPRQVLGGVGDEVLVLGVAGGHSALGGGSRGDQEE
mmetsp:Transcript_40439/g.90910  ORF Transcript_40439/g.90910 Transcript_40439/m.90910 type:complete len:236 (-) Transcript_40439:75-782(-)